MTKKKIDPTEILKSKIEKIEKFITNRSESRKSLIKFPGIKEPEGKDLPANIVIAEAFDQLEHVLISGIDKEGKWWFSMSMQDDAKALWILENFKMAILDSAMDIEYNEGREI